MTGPCERSVHRRACRVLLSATRLVAVIGLVGVSPWGAIRAGADVVALKAAVVVAIESDGTGGEGVPDGLPLGPPPSSSSPASVGTDPATGSPLSWDAGEDQGPNNLIVRTFDVVRYRVDWSLNEQAVAEVNDLATNVVVTLTLSDDPSTDATDMVWDGATDLAVGTWPPTCLTSGVTPLSGVSADGRTLTCNLGAKHQGSTGVIHPIARVQGSHNGIATFMSATITADQVVTPGVSNQVSVTASARPQWNWFKEDGECSALIPHGECGSAYPLEIRNVVDAKPGSPTFGANGRLFLQPIYMLPGGSGMGTEPLASPVSVNFVDDYSRYPDGARLLDFTPTDLAITTWDESRFFDGDGCTPLQVPVMRRPFGDSGAVGATAANTTTRPGDWTCSDSGSQVISVHAADLDSATPPVFGADDYRGDPTVNSSKVTASGQVVIWVPEGSAPAAVGACPVPAVTLQDFASPCDPARPRHGSLYNYIGDSVVINGGGGVSITPVSDGMVGVSGAPNLPSAETVADNDTRYTYDLTAVGPPVGDYDTVLHYVGNDDSMQSTRTGSFRIPGQIMSPGDGGYYREGAGVAAPGYHGRIAWSVMSYHVSRELGTCLFIDNTNQLVADLPAIRVDDAFGTPMPGPSPTYNSATDIVWADDFGFKDFGVGTEMVGHDVYDTLVPGVDFTVEYAYNPNSPKVAAGEVWNGDDCGDSGTTHSPWSTDAPGDNTTAASISGAIDWSQNIADFAGPVIRGVQTYTITNVRFHMIKKFTGVRGSLTLGYMVKPAPPIGYSGTPGPTGDPRYDLADPTEVDPIVNPNIYVAQADRFFQIANGDPLDFNALNPSAPSWSYPDPACPTHLDPNVNDEHSPNVYPTWNVGCFVYMVDMVSIPRSQVSITTTVVDPQVRYKVGDLVTFEINAIAAGADVLTSDVVVTDALPEGLAYVSDTASSTTSLAVTRAVDPAATAGTGGVVSWTYGGGSSEALPFAHRFTVTARVVGGTPFGSLSTNASIVGAIGSDSSDVDAGSAAASATVLLVGPYEDLVISKQVATMRGTCTHHPVSISPPRWAERCSTVRDEDNLRFSLEVENRGSLPLQNVRVIDVFPYDGDQNEPQTLGSAGDGRPPGSNFNGTVGFASSSVVDRSLAQSPTAMLFTMDDPSTVNRDPDAQSNGGPLASVPSTSTTWCDGIGGTAVVGSGSCPATAADVTAVTWTIAALEPGGLRTIDLELTTTGNSGKVANENECSWYTNTFGARSDTFAFPIRSNDVTAMVQCVDVAVDKRVKAPRAVGSGEPLTFEVEVGNDGPDPATNVVVDDVLPAGWTFVSAAPAPDSVLGQRVSWSIDAIAAADSTVVEVTAVPSSGASALTNFAEVAALDQVDLDSSPDDVDFTSTTHTFPSDTNPPNEDDEASAAVATVGNHVWFDANSDGIRDASESPSVGVTMELVDASGTVVASTTTDDNGFYEFVTAMAGPHTVRIAAGSAEGYGPTVPGAGSDEAVDSDLSPVTGIATVNVVLGQRYATADVGLIKLVSPPVVEPVAPRSDPPDLLAFTGSSASAVAACGTGLLVLGALVGGGVRRRLVPVRRRGHR